MKNIEFEYIGKYAYEVCERPHPSKTNLPEWFVKTPPYVPSDENPDGKKLIVRDRESNATGKKCVPMLDSMTCGYTIPLWADVFVNQTHMGPSINWRVNLPVFRDHGNYSADKIPPPPGYSQQIYKYVPHFRIRTPPGYSVLINYPAGHYGMPFFPIPAIVDTDKSVIDSNFPCWVRSDFNGLVEKGTPVAQVIPFKRDNWKHTFTMLSEEDFKIQEDKGYQANIVNNYIKNIWSKKHFK